MAKSSKLTTAKREEVLALLSEFLTDLGEDVVRESGNAITFPSVDAEGNELFVKIAVSIPRGGHDGEAYDGYANAESYRIHLAEVEAKREQRAKEHAEKVKRAREKQAAAKAKKEAEAARQAEFLAKKKEEEGE